MKYFTSLFLLLFNLCAQAQVDTCAERIHAVSDTPCSNRILHLAIEADTLPHTIYTWEGPGGWTASGDSVTRDSMHSTGTGYYIVTGTRGACIYKDTINVFIRTSPVSPYLYLNNSPVCIGDTLIARAIAGGFEVPTFYLDPWGNDIPHRFDTLIIPNMQINMAGEYGVYFKNIQGCSSDTLYFGVEVDSCALDIEDIDIDKPFIPTLLQSSDPIFRPIFKSGVEVFKMQIYDQSGRKIFETNNGEGWDKTAYTGIYFYIITKQVNGHDKFYKGKITLL